MLPTRPPSPTRPRTSRTGHEGVLGRLRRKSAREAAARTYARSLPVVPVRARGLTIEGADGRRYLDCLSGAGTLALGHNHPVVLEAIRSVLDSGAPLDVPGLATPVTDAFAGELLRTLSPALAAHARIRFCAPGGTDAMDTALRLVRTATGREPVTVLAPGGAECAGEPATAGIVVEPVQCDGVRAFDDEQLRRLRQDTAARGVLLVADEARTGLGRTGAFWGIGHSGVVPDVMVLSGAIGGSLPLSVVVHHDGLDTGAPDGDAPDAFRGNQLAMAAGTATLRHVRENDLARRAAELGARLLGRLRELARAYPCLTDVRGRGLMIGLEFTAPGEAPADASLAAGATATAVRQECLRRGLIVGPGGPDSAVLRLLPPLTLTDGQAEAVLDRLADAVAAVCRPGHRFPAPRTPKEAGAPAPTP
ncbi:aminotransferase class III-fold pyridoxal phosphate-dependent enzyme [Streptomyces sp. NPDC049585]|uniref:aminotransferase class III-fold pyridoxal phosphate-dependent enzyme n=1 Tax=Streptomyces sp. NPDC049585 TaxID=3155154 RepID=UPI0034251692